MARWQSGYATDCNSVRRGFESLSRLQLQTSQAADILN